MKIPHSNLLPFSKYKQKFALLIAIFLMVNFFAQAQRINNLQHTDKIIETLGITARCIDFMPFELSYLKLTQKRGIGVNIGFGNYEIKKSQPKIMHNESTVGVDISHMGYFTRFRYMPFLKQKTNSITYTSFNLLAAYNLYNLGVKYKDQIFGENTFDVKHNFLSVAAEVEYGAMQELTKNLILNYGIIGGLKLYDPILFIVPGNFQNHINYMPGAGFGRIIYLNLNIGISYVL